MRTKLLDIIKFTFTSISISEDSCKLLRDNVRIFVSQEIGKKVKLCLCVEYGSVTPLIHNVGIKWETLKIK
jgi:hypothetical protein